MNQIITKNLLSRLGLDLDEKSLEQFNEDLLNELNKRVIDQVIAELDEVKLRELAELSPEGADLMPWLDKNVPHFDEIVAEETLLMIEEIAQNSPKID
ncbi:hypothetical protein EOL73_02305 [Candidatus Saccharibacteria bacterium]|nr:hypothetical protein [Candidatus Saccharibacteria bacterium]NCU40568.1 hypothetical protein [Candidatus Saccharibacteria bacterium]